MKLMFDLDDTLVPSSRSYEVGMRVLGLAPDDPTFLKARADVKAACPALAPAARSRRLYFKRWLENRGSFRPKTHLNMVEKYEAAVCEFIVTEWYDLQRPKTFEQLRELSDGIGIVTNEISVFQSRKLQAMDSGWQYFDFLVTSEDVGREKPAPEIFRRGLELARARADECVFIGDSYEHDILGAAALGMQAVLTTEFTDNAHGPHHLRIQYLNELPDLLPRIANRLQAKS